MTASPILVTYDDHRRTPGTISELQCPVHNVQVAEGYPGDWGPRHRPLVSRPYRFVARFYDEAGTGQCDRCVLDGLKAGTVDLTNPEALEATRPAPLADGLKCIEPQLPAVIEARDILAEGRWGEDPLAIFERAIEAASRQGRLGQLAARFLDVAMEHADS